MARPMILIKRETLTHLYFLRNEGVPVSELIRKHNISVTRPTLAKLFTYIDASEKNKRSKKVDEIIFNSMFPKWLNDAEEDVVKQPPEWRYEGRMPLGKWVLNEWAEKAND